MNVEDNMSGEVKFLEKLNGLLKMAKDNASQITIEEVKAYFSEDALTEEQMDLVFEYLLAQKVSVMGYVKMNSESEVEFTEEEQAYLKEYQQILDEIRPEAPGEITDVIRRAVANDDMAKARLIELYMPRVIEIAKELYSPEVFLGDLIQEGNLGLVLGVDVLEDVESAHRIIIGQIQQSMQFLLEEQAELTSRDKKMIEKVENLDKSIQTLTEELGRKVTIDELAVYMGLEVEEIEDILKLAGEDTETEESQE